MVESRNINTHKVARSEWIWLILISIGIVAFSNLPYLLEYIASNDTYHFAGITVAPEDNLSYIAKIRQGAMGNWLFRLSYTSEYHKGSPIYSFYLLLGHLSRIIHFSPELIFHITRIFGGLVLLLNIYLLISDIIENLDERRFVFLIAALSSGLGWLIILLHGKTLSTDITVPESNTFFSLMDTAHFTWAQAILIVIWREFIRLWEQSGHLPGSSILLGIESILLTIIQPFMFAVLFGAISLFLVFQFRKITKEHKNRIYAIVAVLAVNIILLSFIFGWLYLDPIFKQWNNQIIASSPPVLYFILGYGLNLIPMVYGIKLIYRKGATEKILLCWLLCVAIGLYFPINLQRRLSLGFHIPISILAGIGFLEFITTKLKSVRFDRVFKTIYLLSVVPTSFMLVLIFSGGALNHHEKLFLSNNEFVALQWLEETVESDKVILSSSELGTFIPAFTNDFAVSGHAYETIYYIEKNEEIKDFYSHDMSSNERRTLLGKWRPSYIILGPRESKFCAETLTQDDGASLLKMFDDVYVYSVISSPE